MLDLVTGEGQVIVAAKDWLLADPAIDEATDGRVYAHELPDDEAPAMPRRAVVVSAAGGFTDGLPGAMDRTRADARSYGATPDDAFALAVLVRRRMNALTRWVAPSGLVLSGGLRQGSYIPLREQIGGWPFVLRSYVLTHPETAA